MSNQIVQVNVSVLNAGTPSTLQATGAFLSQGGTTLSTGTYSLLTSASSLTALLAAALSVTGIVQSGGTATATTAAPHGITTSDTFWTTIAGSTIAAYNGNFLATATGASTFTYAVPSGTTSPATGTITYTDRGVTELIQMNTTFWAQGSQTPVYVLELGAGEDSAAITELGTFITANQGMFYAYLAPRSWSGDAGWFTFLAGFEAANAKTYFFSTASTGNYTSYTAPMKDAWVLIEAPAVASTEFSCAAPFWSFLSNAPSAVNQVPPFAFRYVFGVTPYPPAGNSTLFATLKTANVNIIGTGAQGGISTAIIFWGTMKDGSDASIWYSIDWMQINGAQALANAVINGSNNPLAPLYYNQPGINTLQSTELGTVAQGISYGLVNGQLLGTTLTQSAFVTALEAGAYDGFAIVNAIPFPAYTAANPNDYAIGNYAGISVAYTPQRGFITIVMNLTVNFL